MNGLTFKFVCSILVISFFGLFSAAADPTLVGPTAVIFSAPTNDTYSGVYLGGKDTRTNPDGAMIDQWKHPFFDGPVAPISYLSGSTTMLRFNVSSYRNFQVLSTLTNGTIGAGSLSTTPVYTSTLSASNSAFTWKEWLYGTFRDAPSGKLYSVIYNEYYGGDYRDGIDGLDAQRHPVCYSALGLATSTSNGAIFNRLSSAPGHVFVKADYLYPFRSGVHPELPGFGYFGGIFKSPIDGYYYVGAHSKGGEAMLRTSNLDDPTSWRAWNATHGWVAPTTPLYDPSEPAGPTYPFTNVNFYPFYIGYSDYFKKYIGTTTGNSGGQDLIVYNLSDDLLHWGPPRKLIYNPSCGADHVCSPPAETAISSYATLTDPTYLSTTTDSVKSSNGITGAQPLVLYINNSTVPTNFRQQLTTQKVDFTSVTFNRMDNFSVRGVVQPDVVMGFLIQGTEAKQFIFRGLGPSLVVSGYSDLARPQISLYDGNGSLIASNAGYTSLSPQDKATLAAYGVTPSSPNESALVQTIVPGTYTVVLHNYLRPTCQTSCSDGMAQVEAYDISSTAESKIATLSIRGYSQPGNGALTMGFLSRGGQRALVRGTSTSTLAPLGFSPVIPDPNLVVWNGATQIDANNDWQTDPNKQEIINDQVAPGNSLESATIFNTTATLPTRFSPYTVQLQGTGYGLLELFNVNTY